VIAVDDDHLLQNPDAYAALETVIDLPPSA
jgi:hypothetical protein